MPIGWAIVVVVQALAIIALAAVVLGVLRQVTPLLDRSAEPSMPRIQNQGPVVGSKLPPFAGRDGGGEILNAAQLLGRPTMLLFLSATCAPCVTLADEISAISASAEPGELVSSLIVVIDPNDHAALRLPTDLRVLMMPTSEIAEVFDVHGRPFAMAVDADGVVRDKRGLNTVDQLASLTATVVPPAVPVRASVSDAH